MGGRSQSSAAQRVQQRRKEGESARAIQEGLDALASAPNDGALRLMLGWAIYDEVKSRAARLRPGAPPDAKLADELATLMRTYARLKPRLPELAYSLMLTQVVKLKDAAHFLPRMLLWSGIEGFRGADFLPPEHAGRNRAIPSLAERAFLAAAKVALAAKGQDADVLRFLLDLAAAVRRRAEHTTDWLTYREAQLLIAVGEHGAARTSLRNFVRRHGDKFWAWHALSSSVVSAEPALAMQMLLHASQQAPGAFGVSVLAELRELARSQRDEELASWAAQREAQLRTEKGWRLPPGLQTGLRSPWYRRVEVEAMTPRLAAAEAASRRYLLGERERRRATFLGVTTSPAGYAQAVFATIDLRGRIAGASAALTELTGWEEARLEPGDAAYVEGASDGTTWMLLSVARDASAPAWALSTLYTGAVEHQNERLGVTWINLEDGEGTGTYWRDQPELGELSPGSAVTLLGATERLRLPDGRLLDFIHVVRWQAEAATRLVREVEGVVEFPEGSSHALLKSPQLPRGEAFIHARLARQLRQKTSPPSQLRCLTMASRDRRGRRTLQVIRVVEESVG